MTTDADFRDIIRVARARNETDANAYLDAGWVMLNVESVQYMEHGWSSEFVLGWSAENGTLVYPDIPPKSAPSTDSDDIPF